MSRMSLVQEGSQGSVNSRETMYGENKQMYMTTGYYKGSRVALKKILAQNISMNRQLLIELKQMKDLQHDHLVQDILEEEEMELDWNFPHQ